MKLLYLTISQTRCMCKTGFTMIEILVVLAIMGVLASLAAPSMQAFFDSQRLNSGVNALTGHLSFARSEAMRRGTRITLCKSNAGVCTITGNWSQGWLVFTDSNRPDDIAKLSTDKQETLLAQQKSLVDQQLVITGLSGTVVNYVSFEPSGRMVQMNGNPMVDSTLRVCSTSTSLDNAKRAIDIVLLQIGRTMVRKDTDGNPLQANGDALSINSNCGVT